MAGVMLYCQISMTASSTFSCFSNSHSSLVINGRQHSFAAFQLLILATGRMASLNSLESRLIFLQLENLPNHEGNCGKPRLSLIFSGAYTQVMNPYDGISPHSCYFLIDLSSISPITKPFTPRTKLCSSFKLIVVLRAEASKFYCTIRGTLSLSTKKQSVLSQMRMRLNSERFSSFLTASTGLIMTVASFELWPRLLRVSMVILFETVLKMTSKQQSICLISFWKVSTSCSRALSQPEPPSCLKMSINLLTTSGLLGGRNLTSKQCPAKERIFSLERSLQMQIIGTLVLLIMLIMAVMPPRSPELIPSTSSIMIKDLAIVFLPKLKDPVSIKSIPLLFRKSLALNQVIEYPNSFAMSLAVLVLPIPGSPLRRAAKEFILPPAFHPLASLTSRLLPRIWMSYQDYSHSLRDFIWVDYPITSSSLVGLYLSLQSKPAESGGGEGLCVSMSIFYSRWMGLAGGLYCFMGSVFIGLIGSTVIGLSCIYNQIGFLMGLSGYIGLNKNEETGLAAGISVFLK